MGSIMAPNTTQVIPAVPVGRSGCPLGCQWDTSVSAPNSNARLGARQHSYPGYSTSLRLPSDPPANHKAKLAVVHAGPQIYLARLPSRLIEGGPGEIYYLSPGLVGPMGGN